MNLTPIENDCELIAFEGIDGSGKTTQLELFREHLEDIGLAIGSAKLYSSSSVFHHSLNDVFRQIPEGKRYYLWSWGRILAIVNLYVEMKRKLFPLLGRYRVILLDRYTHTQLAYGYGRLSYDFHFREMLSAFPVQTATFYIDVPVESALARVHERIPGDRPSIDENIHILSGAREAFLSFSSEDPGYYVIDGTGPAREVSREVVGIFTSSEWGARIRGEGRK